MKNRELIRCPVCQADQHIYNKRICVHDNGILRCTGSKMLVTEAEKYNAQNNKGKV